MEDMPPKPPSNSDNLAEWNLADAQAWANYAGAMLRWRQGKVIPQGVPDKPDQQENQTPTRV